MTIEKKTLVISEKRKLEIEKKRQVQSKVLKRIPYLARKEVTTRSLNMSTQCYFLFKKNIYVDDKIDSENREDIVISEIANLSAISDYHMEKYKPYRHYLRFGSVFITTKSRNSFMTLTTDKGKIRYLSSTGALKSVDSRILYKGKAKSSSVARRSLAQAVGRKAWAKNYRILDINIRTNKGLGSTYVPFMEGLRIRPLVIRRIVYQNSRPHGYVRLKNMRRI